jgi:chromosome segregation ATPase
LHHKIEHLDADVARQAGAYRRLDEAFDHFRSRAKTEKEALTKELSATRKKLNSALSNVKLLEAKLLAADKAAHENWLKEREDDVKDHQSINDLHQALDKETKANAVLQVSLDEKIKQLLEVQHELQVAKDGQAASRKEIARLNEQIDQLKQDIADKERTIGRYESDLASLRDGNAALEAEKTKLSLDFNNMFAELHKTEQELSVAREEVAGLSDTVSKQKAAIQGLTDQLQDQKDQNVQLRSQSEKTISELLSRVEALLKHDVEDEQKLAELAKQMEILSDALNKARADDEQDKQTIEGLKNSVKKLNGIQKKLQDKIGELTGHDAGDDVEIEEMKKIIADLKAKVAETVAQKSASEGTADELKKQLDNMQKKVDEVTSDDAKDKLEIEKLKTAQENGEKAIKDLETQANAAKKASEDAKKKALEAEAARQSAEAAAAKAAAERDEAHKPVLPNDVVSFQCSPNSHPLS